MLMSWRRKEPGHQSPFYWLCWTGLIGSADIEGYYMYIETEKKFLYKISYILFRIWLKFVPKLSETIMT